MASSDFCRKSWIYIDPTAVFLTWMQEEKSLGGGRVSCEVVDFNRNENVEPIGALSLARVFDAKSIM